MKNIVLILKKDFKENISVFILLLMIPIILGLILNLNNNKNTQLVVGYNGPLNLILKEDQNDDSFSFKKYDSSSKALKDLQDEKINLLIDTDNKKVSFINAEQSSINKLKDLLEANSLPKFKVENKGVFLEGNEYYYSILLLSILVLSCCIGVPLILLEDSESNV
ncbi:MAG: hypothetical protein ACRCTA_04285, partial [Bacilli bacterium]